MTTRLAPLRDRLAGLRRLRRTLRLGNAAAAVGLAVVATLVSYYAVDWLFEFNRLQRLILLCGAAMVIGWSWKRWLAPELAVVETELDMALAVERQQGIDSDLVAALQFESPGARAWGSAGLEEAVIEYVAEFGRDLNVFQGLDQNGYRRRLRLLGAVFLLVLIAGAVYPRHVAAFVNRLFLGAAHYPTRTVIERVALNGVEVLPAPLPATPIRVPFGRSLRADVQVAGQRPGAGWLRLTSVRNGLRTAVELQPAVATIEPGVGDRSAPTEFTGTLARLTEGATYELFVGDAWTDPAVIEVVPLPVVAIDLKPTPPDYAARTSQTVIQPGARQISAMEGSRVSLQVTCSNKPLKSVTLFVGMKEYALASQDNLRQKWALLAGDTPLSRVLQPVSFEVRAVDDDGLAPEQPLKGQIHLEPDRLPRVAAAIITEQVLPSAKPSLSYGATDDYGLAELRLRRQVVRVGGATEEEVSVIATAHGIQPPTTALRGRHVIELKPLGLVKGDEVRVTLEALDDRGDRPGSVGLSETVTFKVTDESGILAGLVETDEKSARRLDDIIQRQLGIGEAK